MLPIYVVVAESCDLDNPYAEVAFYTATQAYAWAKEQNDAQEDKIYNYTVSACDLLSSQETHRSSTEMDEDQD